MTPQPQKKPPLDYEPKRVAPRAPRDDLAYIAPMAVFLAFVWAGGRGQSIICPASKPS